MTKKKKGKDFILYLLLFLFLLCVHRKQESLVALVKVPCFELWTLAVPWKYISGELYLPHGL